MFTAADIQARVRRQPFTRFRIVTSSGEAYEITHPESIVIGRRGVALSVRGEDAPEEYHYLSIMHITAMEAMPVGKRKNGNGKPRL